jgi:hypothetical protein
MNRAENLVLVEGSDDLHFLLHLLYHHGFAQTDLFPGEHWAVMRSDSGDRVEFKFKDGFTKLASDLRLEITPTHLKRIAIVVDTDSDLNSRWDAVRNAIARSGLASPDEIQQTGVVIREPDKPILGAWLMPDNVRPGYLEHLLAEMIDDADRLWPYAISCVQNLDTIERRFPPVRTKKAEVHTWLAWQEVPGARLSEAVVRHYVRPNCDAAQRFINWFNRWLTTPLE